MNEQTEKLLNEALAGAIEAVKTTGNFVVEQAPDVVRQLIAYNIAAACVGIATSIVITGVLTYGLYKSIKYLIKDDAPEAIPLPSVVLGIPILVSVTVTSKYVMELLKLTLAPKVWLLEYAASLVK